jgi:hypothetical protein
MRRVQPASDDRLYGDVSEESKLLREDGRRANDQALSIKGYAIATAAVLAGFALSDKDVPPDNRLALFAGLQLLQVVLSLMVRARREQQAHLIAYELVYSDSTSAYEQRMERLRRLKVKGISVDRWFEVSEGALVVILATVGTIGTVVNLPGSSPAAKVASVIVNVFALLIAGYLAFRRRTIGVLIETCRQEWLLLKNSESTANP